MRSSRAVSVDSSSFWTSGTTMIARKAAAGTSSSVVSVSATTSAVRGLPVSAAISPKKSPLPMADRPR